MGKYIMCVFLTCLCAACVFASVPPEWEEDNRHANLLYSPTDNDVKAEFMPAIGNGYIGTQIGSDSMYVSGVYNGLASETPSHRARIPSTVAFRGPGTVEHTALNMREASFVYSIADIQLKSQTPLDTVLFAAGDIL